MFISRRDTFEASVAVVRKMEASGPVLERITLFGVRTPLVGDYVESCLRRGIEIATAVQVDGQASRLPCGYEAVPLSRIGQAGLAPFIAAAFVPARRRELVGMALAAGLTPAPALLDPTSVIASTSPVDHGTYINALSVVASASRIGAHVFINRACNIGHHVMIADFVSFGPGVTVPSGAHIGEGAVIGAGAVLLPGVVVGAGAVVSAGTRLHCDVPDRHLAIGAGPVIKPIRDGSRLLEYPGQE